MPLIHIENKSLLRCGSIGYEPQIPESSIARGFLTLEYADSFVRTTLGTGAGKEGCLRAQMLGDAGGLLGGGLQDRQLTAQWYHHEAMESKKIGRSC